MPIFYEITAPNGKKSHLFGTLHLENIDLKFLPPEIETAFSNSQRYVFEMTELWTMSSIERATVLIEADSRWEEQQGEDELEHNSAHIQDTLKKLLPNQSEQFYQIDAKTDTPISIADHYIEYFRTNHPVQISPLEETLDKTLYKRATSSHKEIYSLETLISQYSRLKGLGFSSKEHMIYFNFITSLLIPELKIKLLSGQDIVEAR